MKNMMKRGLLSVVTLLGMALVLAGCPATPTTPSNSISISEITPAKGTNLTLGQEVTFNVTVKYTLVSADTGTVTLLTQDQDNNGLGLSDTKTISKGSSTESLSVVATVPSTGATTVTAFVFLTPEGESITGIVDSEDYTVQ